MNYWVISDTHFNHDRLREYSGRPADFGKRHIDGIRAIPAEDTLIHLGDICMGQEVLSHQLLMSAPCKKILVRGNHDKKSMNWYLEHGWDFVCDGIHLQYMGKTLLLTHRPLHPDMWRFTHNIHGHTHGNLHRSEEFYEWYSKDYHIDISPELVGYEPIELETLIKKL